MKMNNPNIKGGYTSVVCFNLTNSKVRVKMITEFRTFYLIVVIFSITNCKYYLEILVNTFF